MEKTRKDIKSFQNVFDALRHISESQPRFLSLTVWGQQTLGENQAVSTGKSFYFCLLKCFSYNNSAYLGMAQRHTLAWERKPRTIIGMPAEGLRKLKKIDLKNIDKIVNETQCKKLEASNHAPCDYAHAKLTRANPHFTTRIEARQQDHRFLTFGHCHRAFNIRWHMLYHHPAASIGIQLLFISIWFHIISIFSKKSLVLPHSVSLLEMSKSPIGRIP